MLLLAVLESSDLSSLDLPPFQRSPTVMFVFCSFWLGLAYGLNQNCDWGKCTVWERGMDGSGKQNKGQATGRLKCVRFWLKACHQMQLNWNLPLTDRVLIWVCKQLIYYSLGAVKPPLMIICICSPHPVLASPPQLHLGSSGIRFSKAT